MRIYFRCSSYQTPPCSLRTIFPRSRITLHGSEYLFKYATLSCLFPLPRRKPGSKELVGSEAKATPFGSPSTYESMGEGWEAASSHHHRKSQRTKALRVVVLSLAVIVFVLFVQTFVFRNPTNPSRIAVEGDSIKTSLGDKEDCADPNEENIEIDIENDVDIDEAVERTEVASEELPLANSRKDFALSMVSTLNSKEGCDGNCKISVYQIPSSTTPPPEPVVTNIPVARKKTRKPRKRDLLRMKTYYRSDVEQLLIKNRDSPLAMVPKWRSPVDRTFVEAKAQITNTPMVSNDPDLYPPAYRNYPMFKRSYELMEQNLKVYVYKEGKRPVFHEPFLDGIYASEGWFMKHMEENKHFLVDDPGKAHLFYIPLSSRLLQTTLFDYQTRSKSRMYAELRSYIGNISSNYPFWNRSGGADHFVVCCHDWSARETEVTMPTTIRALCGADIHEGFEVGKDISLPESNIFDGKNPLLDVGGEPANKRKILAFFAGKMFHGHVRPMLQHYWGNDTDIKIYSDLGVSSDGTLIRKRSERKRVSRNRFMKFMKNSKFCLCPRGYEVNSPRLVESIFYDCVPVIISNNYVPPFFEILNWDAFSLILPESDVPRLKEILLSIPQEKYEELHRGVRMIQKHFLWNKKPLKYDMFHMVLYNAWFNRIFQLRVDAS